MNVIIEKLNLCLLLEVHMDASHIKSKQEEEIFMSYISVYWYLLLMRYNDCISAQQEQWGFPQYIDKNGNGLFKTLNVTKH